jgi:ribonuclease HII
MVALDREFPGYGFARHKGYGTTFHNAALLELGPCIRHRKSFAPIAKLLAR